VRALVRLVHEINRHTRIGNNMYILIHSCELIPPSLCYLCVCLVSTRLGMCVGVFETIGMQVGLY